MDQYRVLSQSSHGSDSAPPRADDAHTPSCLTRLAQLHRCRGFCDTEHGGKSGRRSEGGGAAVRTVIKCCSAAPGRVVVLRRLRACRVCSVIVQQCCNCRGVTRNGQVKTATGAARVTQVARAPLSHDSSLSPFCIGLVTSSLPYFLLSLSVVALLEISALSEILILSRSILAQLSPKFAGPMYPRPSLPATVPARQQGSYRPLPERHRATFLSVPRVPSPARPRHQRGTSPTSPTDRSAYPGQSVQWLQCPGLSGRPAPDDHLITRYEMATGPSATPRIFPR